MHRFVTHRRDVIKSNTMHDSPFTNPLDWYNANKQHLPAGFSVFENPHAAFIFKWKKIAAALLPLLRGYTDTYYPDLENLTSQQEAIEKAHERFIFTLAESVCRTIEYSAAGYTVQEKYPVLYPLMRTAIGHFKMTDRFIDLANPPEWVQMIPNEKEREEAAAAENNMLKKIVEERRALIDAVQPVIMENLPGILNINGEWWMKYEYDYVYSYGHWHHAVCKAGWAEGYVFI